MDKIFITIIGISGMIGTYWFFLMKKEQEAVTVNADNIDITVNGGYSPNVISIPKGKTTTLNFTRVDPSSCLEDVIFGDFKIRKYLPLNKVVPIIITPHTSGTFDYVCGMNMFHGKIIVK